MAQASLRTSTERTRCTWAEASDSERAYHDAEWGAPVYDDNRLFEMITLEGAQAGLSWSTILNKREGYRRAFAGFDPARVARFTPQDINRLVLDPGIVRHRGKIESTVNNARRVLEVQQQGGLAKLLWGFVGGEPQRHAYALHQEIPAESAESRAMSKELKRRGFGFVGPTTCYAMMQATGMVNDHLTGCFRYHEVGGAPPASGPRG